VFERIIETLGTLSVVKQLSLVVSLQLIDLFLTAEVSFDIYHLIAESTSDDPFLTFKLLYSGLGPVKVWFIFS